MSKSGYGTRCLVVCGPTASGKSEYSDYLGSLADSRRVPCSTFLFDSMQVYREIPILTNQYRSRHANLCGMVSVSDEWSVSHHKEAFEELIADSSGDGRVVMESGTGMYLNVSLLGIPMARKVSPEVRLEAERRVAYGLPFGPSEYEVPLNPRREVRAEELRIAGSPERASIWDGNLVFETSIVYIRPDRATLDIAISERSRRICSDGLDEARTLLGSLEDRSATRISKTVADSIGVRELTSVLRGEMSYDEAEERVEVRTRQLARRQMRWFDKLIREVKDDPNLRNIQVLESPYVTPGNINRNTIHELDGTISWWMD